MTSPDTATLIEEDADRIADISRADLQIMLRRAALLLRNSGSISFEDDMEKALRDLADQRRAMTRSGSSCDGDAGSVLSSKIWAKFHLNTCFVPLSVAGRIQP